MKVLKVVLLSCLLSVFSFCCYHGDFATRPKTYKKRFTRDILHRDSVIKLYVLRKGNKKMAITATGFAVSKDLFLTAAHFCKPVLDGQYFEDKYEKEMRYAYIKDDDRFYLGKGLQIVDFDQDSDLCLLEKKNHGFKPVVFASGYKNYKVGDKVKVVGAPLGVFPVLTEGRLVSVSGVHVDGCLTMSVPVAKGNSGGPVFSKGKVIGVLVMVTSYPHLSFAVKLDLIYDFLSGRGL